jgi:hypothetical protein
MSTATAAIVPPMTAMPSSVMACLSAIIQVSVASSTTATRRTGLMSVSPFTRPLTMHMGQATSMVTTLA